MTIKESIDTLTKDTKSEEKWIDLRGLVEQFEICDWIEQDENNPRFRVYFLQTWYCTDTWVGYRAWYLDDELMAITYQAGRKYDQKFNWISNEMFLKAKKAIDELRGEKDYHFYLMSEDDWNIDMDKKQW